LEAVRDTVAEHTAGSPVDPEIVWTNRSPRDIARELRTDGFTIHPDTVRRILREDLGLGLREAVKEQADVKFPFRNEQFEHIAERRAWYERKDWPVVSIDAKQRELLGDFFRAGRAYTDGFVRVRDHDFAAPGQLRLTPYGVYDVRRNEGFLRLSLGPETSELACDALERWWTRLGRQHYWHASGLLVLCDSGGGNGCRRHVFKEQLYRLACRLHRPIEVAHYPPGCSKYDPIERKLFCHVARAMQGVVLRTIDVAARFMARTTTATGLRVIVETTAQIYETGRKAAAEFLRRMPIRFHDFLPQLNYTAVPYA
jgi:hypothetical protein